MAAIEAKELPVSLTIKQADPRQVSALRSFVAGLSAGCFSTIAGYPPDTIKVRLQTQPITQPPAYTGAVNCCVKMVQAEGFSSLFRGMSMPLASRAIVNALCFSSYSHILSAFNNHHADRATVDPKETSKPPPLAFAFLAGGAAGAISALIACPSELIKVQMQAGGVVAGPIAQTKRVLKAVGLRGLMIGMAPTIARDFICMGAFFTTTAFIARTLAANDIRSSPFTSLGAGALAGLAGWALCYPLDVWKSNTQDFMGKGGTSAPRPTFATFFKDRYQKLGLRGLYTGLAPTLFRAVPTNAAKFFAFDMALRIMSLID